MINVDIFELLFHDVSYFESYNFIACKLIIKNGALGFPLWLLFIYVMIYVRRSYTIDLVNITWTKYGNVSCICVGLYYDMFNILSRSFGDLSEG